MRPSTKVFLFAAVTLAVWLAPAAVCSEKIYWVRRVSMINLSDSLSDKIKRQFPLHPGDSFTATSLQHAGSMVRKIDRNLGVSAIQNPDGSSDVVVAIPASRVTTPAFMIQPALGVRRVHLARDVMAAKLIQGGQSLYFTPRSAHRIQGNVRFHTLIGKDGQIEELQLISGHPQLVPSATAAVKQWRYRRTILNGKPVEVVTTVDVNFIATQ
jgi:hypothetical protein